MIVLSDVIDVGQMSSYVWFLQA